MAKKRGDLKPRDPQMPETWGFRVRRAVNATAGARSVNSVTPPAAPFYSTTGLHHPTLSKSQFWFPGKLIGKLILINYTSYHKPICVCKSQSDRCYGSTAVPTCAAYEHACFLFIIIHVTWSCFMAPEFCRNAGLPAWILPSLFSLHVFSRGGFIPIYGYITA